MLHCSNQKPVADVRPAVEPECAGDMGRIGKTIEELNRYRQQWLGGDLAEPLADGAPARAGLTEITNFGLNPGQLRMLAYVPEQFVENPPLVVVLHGCRQTAEGYDQGTGWSELAEQHGFIVCLPEQRGGNNPQHCFNWFNERNTTRGSGEAGSIASMVQHLVETHGVDQDRIFVTGLSAGGAMAATMLAAYPDVFAAGAVIAGLPYRAATSIGGALDAMSNGDRRTHLESGASVRGASEHEGPWPRLSVWHGTADETVAHVNAAALVGQWRDLNGLGPTPAREERASGHTRRVWLDASGAEVIVEYELDDFGHGAPLEAAELGQPGPFLMEAGISSTLHIAEFFGVMPLKPVGVLERVLRAAGV
jgi:poly(hydroxyalkanoate) depolymerase family esterase